MTTTKERPVEVILTSPDHIFALIDILRLSGQDDYKVAKNIELLVREVAESCFCRDVDASELHIWINWYMSKLGDVANYPYHAYIVHASGVVDPRDRREDKRKLKKVVLDFVEDLRQQFKAWNLYDHNGLLMYDVVAVEWQHREIYNPFEIRLRKVK